MKDIYKIFETARAGSQNPVGIIRGIKAVLKEEPDLINEFMSYEPHTTYEPRNARDDMQMKGMLTSFSEMLTPTVGDHVVCFDPGDGSPIDHGVVTFVNGVRTPYEVIWYAGNRTQKTKESPNTSESGVYKVDQEGLSYFRELKFSHDEKKKYGQAEEAMIRR